MCAALVGIAASVPAADAQPATPSPSVVAPSSILQPALSGVQSTTAGLNISKWKAPGSVRQAAQQDVDSIQNDLGRTLPNLLASADAAPASIPPSFAVYRNVDALYDVLLRVSETAYLAAPENEASAVADALQRLETARTQLGDSILGMSQRQEAQIVALVAEAQSAKASPAAQTHENVVDDGPAKKTPSKTKKKAATKKPATKPAAETAPAPQ
jgi:hypothetical protein